MSSSSSSIKWFKDFHPDIIKTRVTHPLWWQMQQTRRMIGFPFDSVIGEFQYWYQTKDCKLSVDAIELPMFHQWEICSPQQFFDGPERYQSLEDAEKRVIDLLTTVKEGK